MMTLSHGEKFQLCSACTDSDTGIMNFIFKSHTQVFFYSEYKGDSHLMGRANSLEKTLMLGKIEGKRRKGRQRMRLLDGLEFE